MPYHIYEPEPQIGVPLPTELFLLLVDFLRESEADLDPVRAVERAVDYWLENASWKPELLPEAMNPVEDGLSGIPPARKRGYTWKELFLPHGTSLRMKYKGDLHYAKVDGDNVVYAEKSVSPGEFANTVTSSSRNAWRDVYIRRPGDSEWILADSLRKPKVDLLDAFGGSSEAKK